MLYVHFSIFYLFNTDSLPLLDKTVKCLFLDA